MRIKKVSQAVATDYQVNGTYSTSQSQAYSCDYVNTIVESGSNQYGTWIKYIDGTMICCGKQQHTSARNTSWGSLYVTSKITGASYPMTFTSIKSVALTPEVNSNSVWLITSDEGTTSKLPNFYLTSATSTSSSSTYYINYIAIGTWK